MTEKHLLLSLLPISLWIFILAGCTAQSMTRISPTESPPKPKTTDAEVKLALANPAPANTSQAVETTRAPKPTIKPLIAPTKLPTAKPTSEQDVYAYAQNRRLGRGVNLGNTLEAPDEGEWGVRLEEAYFDLIRQAGFNSIRIPIRWSAHAMAEPPYTIDPVFLQRVDWVVKQTLSRDMAAVINMHHFNELMETPRLQAERFKSIWEQIARHYQNYPDGLYFELLNEPTGTLGATEAWNDLIEPTINAIRKTNPERIIIVGPGNFYSIPMLPVLRLPEKDRRLIVTIHYYSPFQFTHQGAEWAEGSNAWLGTTWQGTEEDKKTILRDFEPAVRWSNANSRPIYLGEFGAYQKGDMDSRARWTEFMARTAEKTGWSWAYWEFCSGFGVYDPENRAWREPLLKALIP